MNGNRIVVVKDVLFAGGYILLMGNKFSLKYVLMCTKLGAQILFAYAQVKAEDISNKGRLFVARK